METTLMSRLRIAVMRRPVHRSTLAEQLQKTLRMPQQKSGAGKILGKVARTALSGIAVYVVVNILSGKTGQKRLRQDFAIVTVRLLIIACISVDMVESNPQDGCNKHQRAVVLWSGSTFDIKKVVESRYWLCKTFITWGLHFDVWAPSIFPAQLDKIPAGFQSVTLKVIWRRAVLAPW